ncbi:RHS domain-containing protein [Chitinibacter bivalviorum]|uniref:RHS domain-containing protein n=1 Tax=Chitinibacter bivalviorum TaxID=2739434 RepID=A0A7H9BM68_9NEIS|nr:RHS repeat-associated core domain-containing protein [Chitinibacter bivalviorum]QLG89569.1 RHS domain-containing protein [Chitinibacter bivalviorum]
MSKSVLFCVLSFFLNIAHGEAVVSGAGLPLKNINLEDNLPIKRNEAPDAHFEQIDPFSGSMRINIPILSWSGNGKLPIGLSWNYRQGAAESRGVFVPRVRINGQNENLCGIPAQHARTEGIYQYDSLLPVLEMPDGSTFELHAKDWTFQSFISINQWKLTCSGPNSAVLESPAGLTYRLDQKHAGKLYKTDYLPNYFTQCQIGNINTCAEYGKTDSSVLFFSPSQIKGPNTESLSLEYLSGKIAKITATDGRVVQLGYSGGNLINIRAGERIWQFSGNSSTDLLVINEPDVLITNPDGSSWKIGFYQAERIPALKPLDMFVGLPNRITTPQGGVINYEYGWQPYDLNAFANLNSPACLRVDASPADKEQCKGIIKNAIVGNALVSQAAVWKKTTSDGGVWVYSTFAPAANLFINRSATTPLDVRKVLRPDGSTEVTSYMNADDVVSCTTDRWKIGLQKKSEILDSQGRLTQSTEFAWSPLKISSFGHHFISLETNEGLSCIGQQVNIPLQDRVTINRQGAQYTEQSTFDVYARPVSVTTTGDGVSRNTTYAYYMPPSAWRLDRIQSETISADVGQPAVSAIARSFDIYGNLLLENKNGVVTEFDNFPNGELRSVKDPRGLVTTFDNYYRGVPLIETKQVATGQETLSCLANVSNATINRTVDDFGNITSVKNPRGNVTVYRYDNMDRVVTVTPPSGNPTNIQWSPTSRTATRGSMTQYESWDGFGRSNQKILNGFATTSIIDSLGRKTYESYPGTPNQGDTFSYDTLGRITKIVHADGTSRSYSYSGSEVTEIEERGVKTTFQYRAIGNPDKKELIRVSPALVSETAVIERDLLGKVRKVTQNNVSRTWVYDSKHYLVQRTDPELGTTTFVNDLAGNVVIKQVNQLPATSYTYDGNNKVKTISVADQSMETACLSYDENANLIAQKTNTINRAWAYDANNNLSNETLTAAGNSYTLQYAYDANDQRASITYPTGQKIDLYPDAFGRPTGLGSYVTGLKYNPRHQVLEYRNANGRINQFDFGVRGWPTLQKLVPANSQIPQAPVSPTPPAPFTQSPPVAPTAPAQPGYAEPGATMSADTACRALYREPLLSDFNGLSGASDRYKAAYATWQSQMASCTTSWNQRGTFWSDGQAGCRAIYPPPLSTQYVRPEQYQSALSTWTTTKLNPCLADWQPKATAWNTYRSQVATYNQQYQSYQSNLAAYNQAQQQYQQSVASYNQAKAKYDQDLIAYNNAVIAARVLVDTRYGFDAVGNLITVTDSVYPNWDRSNSYDEVDRLLVSDGPWGKGDIYYDGNGNITKQSFGDYRLEYGYEPNQKLKTVTGNKSYSLTYDGWGNLSSRGDGQTYQYDAAGNLRWVNKGSASQIAYTYDGAGTRVLSVGNGQNKLEFTGLDGLLYFDKDLSTGASSNHLYLGRQKLVDADSNGTTTYYHNDAVGSPIAATDASGSLLWRASYKPFGDKATDGSPSKNQQWFTGKPHEEAIGLTYFGARWYDPLLGRFAAIDPVDWNVSNPIHSFNRYAYANNNPFKFVDPDGRQPEGNGPENEGAKIAGRSVSSGALMDMMSLGVSPSKISKAPGFGEQMDALGPSGQFSSGLANVASRLGSIANSLKGRTEGISVSEALDAAANFLGLGSIRTINKPTGVQMINSFTDEKGNSITLRAGFDINPSNKHVQELGPHLNLQTQINSVVQGKNSLLADPHIAINPSTIIKGDY